MCGLLLSNRINNEAAKADYTPLRSETLKSPEIHATVTTQFLPQPINQTYLFTKLIEPPTEKTIQFQSDLDSIQVKYRILSNNYDGGFLATLTLNNAYERDFESLLLPVNLYLGSFS